MSVIVRKFSCSNTLKTNTGNKNGKILNNSKKCLRMPPDLKESYIAFALRLRKFQDPRK